MNQSITSQARSPIPPQIPSNAAVRAVCAHLGIDHEEAFAMADKRSKESYCLNRLRDNVAARTHLYAWLRDNWGWSYPQIGLACGVGHSTVIESLQRAGAHRRWEPRTR